MAKTKTFETFRSLVMAQETDSNDHMNVQFYTTKYDQATGQLMALLGYDLNELKAQNWGFAYVETTIKYLKEVLEDDPIHIESSILACANKVVTVKHEMKNSFTGKLASEAIVKWVLFDKHTRRAIPLPEEMQTKLVSILE